MLEELSAQLLPILASLLVAVVGALTSSVLAKLRQKLHGDYALGVLDRVDSMVGPAVAEQFQLLVDDLKAAAGDGKLTVEEARQAFAAARQRVRDGLGRNGVAAAEKLFGREELERIIRAKIEEAVRTAGKPLLAATLEEVVK